MFDHLFSPLTIRGKTLKNRCVVPAMLTYFCDTHGDATEKYIAYHEEKAKGGFGMIITEDYAVAPKGISFATVPGLWCDAQMESHSKLAERVHRHGALILVQLFHSGMQGDEAVLHEPPKAPSPMMSPFGDAVAKPFTTEEIKALTKQFGDAALRAKKCGFDGIEIHGGHGYLVDQFLSPFMNKRLDEYGGSVWNRTRFAREIIRDIREKCGENFILAMRVSADEFVEGGLTIEESKVIAKILQDAGVDMLDISLGNYSSLEFCMASSHKGPGWYSDWAKEIKSVVPIPVMAVNRINDPFIADNILAEGKSDLIAIGRGSICDPHFPEKARSGRIEDLRKCLGCNVGCVNVLWTAHPIRCVLNPTVGHESDGPITKADTPKKVAVIGAGPAGLYAAIAAKQRGHEVTVYEKESHSGGNFYYASFPPCKGEITEFLIWQLTQCRELGVEIKYGTEITPESLRTLGADHIILATGAHPSAAPIKGLAESKIACFATDVLGGSVKPGRRCVVIGGGEVGAETAHFLALDELKKVTILEMRDDIVLDAPAAVSVPLIKELKDRDVRILTSVNVTEVKDDSVTFAHPDGRVEVIPADMVVTATGYRSYNPLEEAAKASGAPYAVVGDAVKARNALEATTEGYNAGRAI